MPLGNQKYNIYGRKVDSKDYHGPWSWQGQEKFTSSLKEVYKDEANVSYVEYNEAHFEDKPLIGVKMLFSSLLKIHGKVERRNQKLTSNKKMKKLV